MSAHTKVRSEVKWLANELAMVRGELERIDETLVRLTSERRRLQSIEAALRHVAPSLGAEALAVRTPSLRRHGRYGGRGNLRNLLRGALKAAYPKGLDTGTLVDLAAKAFGLEFPTSKTRNRFRNDNLCNALRRMQAAGEVEPMHDAQAAPSFCGVWRLKVNEPTVSALRTASFEADAGDRMGEAVEVRETDDAQGLMWP